MPLPVIQQPIFEVYLKSLDRKVKFRPFLVKEEKILLMTKESNDDETVLRAVKQMISNCCLEDINLDALPTFDVEMFFVHLRMRSISETVMLNYTCEKKNESGEICGFVNEYQLDLDKIKYDILEEHTRDIKLSDKVGVKMNYPVLSNAGLFLTEDAFDNALNLIQANIQYVYDENQVYDRSVFNDEELRQFLETLSTDQISLISEFFTTAPRAVLDDKSVCKKCGCEHRIFAEDLYSFFI